MIKRITLFLLLSVSSTALAGTGEAGFAFLKIGVDARAAGLGEAASAMASDASAAFWNPAGLAFVSRSGVVFTHNRWIEDVTHNFVGFTWRRGGQTFALHYIATGVSDIELRDETASAEPLAYFDSHELSLGLSYARPIGDRWSTGVTVRYTYERIQNSVQALGFDAGVWYRAYSGHDGSDDRWRIGLSVANLGFSGKLVDERVDLPVLVRLGSSYDVMHDLQTRDRLSVACDVVKPLEESTRVHAGLEYACRGKAFLRAGYQLGYEARSFSAGVGVSVWERLRLDYAFVPMKYNLGATHRVSAAFDL